MIKLLPASGSMNAPPFKVLAREFVLELGWAAKVYGVAAVLLFGLSSLLVTNDIHILTFEQPTEPQTEQPTGTVSPAPPPTLQSVPIGVKPQQREPAVETGPSAAVASSDALT